jgi:probable phosphoglycerate mutase
MDLLLLCRAETEAVLQGLTEGGPGWPLTPVGQAQADLLGARLARDHALYALYCGPALECRETAARIGRQLGLAPRVVADLREVDAGEVTGRPRTLLRGDPPHPPRSADIFTAFPGGESYAEMHVRVVKALNGLVEEAAQQTIAAVAHPGPIQAFVLAFLRYAIEQRGELRVCCEPASLHHLRRLHDGRKEIVRLNDLSHLMSEA